MAIDICSWSVHGGSLLLLSSTSLSTRQNATRPDRSVSEMKWIKSKRMAFAVYVLCRRVVMIVRVRRRLMAKGARTGRGGEVKVFRTVHHRRMT